MRSTGNLLLHFLAVSSFAFERAFAARRDGQDQNAILPPAPVIEVPIGKPVTPQPKAHEFVSVHAIGHE